MWGKKEPGYEARGVLDIDGMGVWYTDSGTGLWTSYIYKRFSEQLRT